VPDAAIHAYAVITHTYIVKVLLQGEYTGWRIKSGTPCEILK